MDTEKVAQFYHSDFRYSASNPVPKERLMSTVPHPEHAE